MTIAKDPLYMVICGVGGQGNILISRLLGRALLKKHYSVTIVDTFGVAQRGGAVNSNLRISKTKSYETLISHGCAHIILSLEPLETLRMLTEYGNPEVLTLTNFRPVFPLEVLSGDADYPSYDKLRQAITELSKRCWVLDATGIALKLGAVIVSNVVMLGALVATKLLPVAMQDMDNEIKDSFPPKRAELNLKALEAGFNALK